MTEAKSTPKDVWDKIAVVAGLSQPVTTILVALVGLYFTATYNRAQQDDRLQQARRDDVYRQNELQLARIQTIEKFLPYLVRTESEKKAGIIAIEAAGDAKLAARLAEQFPSSGTVDALTTLATGGDPASRRAAVSSLAGVASSVSAARSLATISLAQIVPAVPDPKPNPFNGALPPHVTAIGFSGLLGGDGAPFRSYEEQGVSITATTDNWLIGKNFGSPAPYVYFTKPAEAETVVAGGLTIAAKFKSFAFRSIDIYSSVTEVRYSLVGFMNSEIVFTETGIMNNTFGKFATVHNPKRDQLINRLEIVVDSMTKYPVANRVGVDNIDIVTLVP